MRAAASPHQALPPVMASVILAKIRSSGSNLSNKWELKSCQDTACNVCTGSGEDDSCAACVAMVCEMTNSRWNIRTTQLEPCGTTRPRLRCLWLWKSLNLFIMSKAEIFTLWTCTWRGKKIFGSFYEKYYIHKQINWYLHSNNRNGSACTKSW